MANPTLSVRAQAAITLAQVLQQQASLASLMTPAQDKVATKDRGLLQELCFGTLRWQPKLQSVIGRLLDKPLKPKDSDIQALLLLGLYQIDYTRIPEHAALSSTVEACRELKKPWASKLLNGVLRRYLRERQSLHEQMLNSPAFQTAHPNWLRKQVEQFWPDRADAIFAANNDHPPFTLRLNSHQQSRNDLLSQMADAKATPFSPFGITLAAACDVTQLPGFNQGWLSVQDEAAQLAAPLMELAPGQRVLDACCAPGGKTGHLLELEPQLDEVVGLELEERRLVRVRENLERLGLSATLICCDANRLDDWWDGKPFDRILLDAPCSATGVIRRHPDIKVLRKATDITPLAQSQLQLLQNLWPTLKPGGLLIYATCSVLPTENTLVVEQFLKQQSDARHIPITADWGQEQTCGRQLLPQSGGHDGFYYCCLRKE
ncbi:MAG: 16S rRNA (cytosine(967)-C(5))-methyltransferase RsmB [Candidatus Pelagadaptatus aseana]|uniref:16S rRNA (cytosine(967)-C(5))-methyltransferase RsmB n=1 Tax=Candidatus Pelagadaptatus aseana TaxID=3120508 RepID=UPI0039B30EB0